MYCQHGQKFEDRRRGEDRMVGKSSMRSRHEEIENKLRNFESLRTLRVGASVVHASYRNDPKTNETISPGYIRHAIPGPRSLCIQSQRKLICHTVGPVRGSGFWSSVDARHIELARDGLLYPGCAPSENPSLHPSRRAVRARESDGQ